MRPMLALPICLSIIAAGCGGAPPKAPEAAPKAPPAAAPASRPAAPPQVGASPEDKPIAPTPPTPKAAIPPATPAKPGEVPQAAMTPPPAQPGAAANGAKKRDPEKAPDDPVAFEKNLLDEWRKMPLKTRNDLDEPKAMNIAAQLWRFGPHGVAPLVDMLGEKDGNPLNKALAAAVLARTVSAKDAKRLIEITQPGNETTGRACAAMLLAFTKTPEAMARARELMDDPERRVRMSAVMELIRFEDKTALGNLKKILGDPALTPQEKEEMLNALPDSTWADNLDFFANCAQDAKLNEDARDRCVTVLGQLGKKDRLPALENVSKNDAHPMVKVHALKAQDVIRAREGMEPLKADPTFKLTTPDKAKPGTPADAKPKPAKH